MDPDTLPMQQSPVQGGPPAVSGAGATPEKPKAKDTESVEPSEAAFVRAWCKKVKKAKKRWEPDLKRMKMNREFAYGFQWNEQESMDDDRYTNNITIRAINQKVATYYARNPKAVFQRRPRLDFEMWDGSLESLMPAMQAVAGASQTGQMPDPNAMALLQDFNNGLMMRRLIERVGRTLEILYQWQVDIQEPEFKKQMKSLVRRVETCGVGYVKLGFVREGGCTPEVPLTASDFVERAKHVKALIDKLDESGDETSPIVEEIKANALSLLASQMTGETEEPAERLVFTFPRASSIIPDWKCSSLKDFVGADFIAEERLLPLSFVNEYYEVKIEGTASEVKVYNEQGDEFNPKDALDAIGEADKPEQKLVCVWEITDKVSKTTFTIVDGWKGFVVEPKPLTPKTHRFWPVFALTFNDCEIEPGDKGSIFPPSDVQLMKSPQKERNRSRQALRQHRKANAPRWVARAGALSETDKENLESCEPNSTTEVNMEATANVQQIIMAVPKQPIEPAVYETESLEKDVELAVGNQQANIGPAQPNVTATVGSIAEQSRMTMASSNVDDLDDLLSDIAKAAGEILLREMSVENVKRVVGRGAVWPGPQERQDFLDEIFLEVKAASSGRPNKGVEMANMREMMPLLIQVGANPQFLVEEMVKRWDDNLDVTKAFPLVPGAGQLPPTGPAGPPQPVQNPGQGERQNPPRPARPGVS